MKTENESNIVKGLFLNFSDKATGIKCYSILTYAIQVIENIKNFKTVTSVFSSKFVLDDFDEPFLHLNAASLYSMTTSLQTSKHYVLEMENYNGQALSLLGLGTGKLIDLQGLGLDLLPMRVALVEPALFNQILQRKASNTFTLLPVTKTA